eukprot:10812609-Alexandrium_andersonii.AAC.1
MAGEPYATQPSASGATLPLRSPLQVNQFCRRFRETGPWKLLGYELWANPKRTPEATQVRNMLVSAAT